MNIDVNDLSASQDIEDKILAAQDLVDKMVKDREPIFVSENGPLLIERLVEIVKLLNPSKLN